jgi:cysteine desulfurase
MIYLDNSATTRPDPSVIDSFRTVSERYFANPSSIHKLGAEVEQLHTKAREQAAAYLEIDQDEVVFTSGGTEGNNMALKGIALSYQHRGKHIITTEIEHASVFETCKGLERLGFEVTYLPVNQHGVINVNQVKAAIRPDTILISIMHVNNEIGAIQPVQKIGKIIKNYPKVFFHVDAVQALGKIPIPLINSGIDLCTFSGHKIHGLKGSGMLFIKKGIRLFPLFHGGGQENGLRSGTENVAGNVAFVRALRLILEQEANKHEHLQKCQQRLIENLHQLDDVVVNSTTHGAPHIVHVSVPGLKPEVVIHQMYEGGFVISTQSACSSKELDISRVLTACGLAWGIATSGIRISLNYDITVREIELFCKTFEQTINKLKAVLE